MPRNARFLALMLAGACGPFPTYDLVLRHGAVYDGTGSEGVVADIAILGDSIVSLGDLRRSRGREEIDATGLAVAPGFINMLSHPELSLIEDPRSQNELRQGVTQEVFWRSVHGPAQRNNEERAA